MFEEKETIEFSQGYCISFFMGVKGLHIFPYQIGNKPLTRISIYLFNFVQLDFHSMELDEWSSILNLFVPPVSLLVKEVASVGWVVLIVFLIGFVVWFLFIRGLYSKML